MKTVPILCVRTFLFSKEALELLFCSVLFSLTAYEVETLQRLAWERHAHYNYCDCKTRRKEKTFALYACLSREVGDGKMRSRFFSFHICFSRLH